ncbi:Hypothetical protein CINCED_3A019142, partial [Cinara cedri]
ELDLSITKELELDSTAKIITINNTTSEKSAGIKSVKEPVISLTHNTDKEPDTAAGIGRTPDISSKITSVQELVLSIFNDVVLDSAAIKFSFQEPAISIFETIDIREHDINEENNQNPDISSEITNDLEPDFAAKKITIINTTSEKSADITSVHEP